jgi:hypothetical protein
MQAERDLRRRDDLEASFTSIFERLLNAVSPKVLRRACALGFTRRVCAYFMNDSISVMTILRYCRADKLLWK